MNLLKLDNLQLNYGEQAIFDNLNLLLKKGDRLCLVGRNGVGKSTLLKVIEGLVDVDNGTLWRQEAAIVSGLTQDLPPAEDRSVFEYVVGGLPQLGEDLARFVQLSDKADSQSLTEMARVQQRIEAVDGWRLQNRMEQILTRLELDGQLKLKSLSGGWRRRAALARALVAQPDVLLLDEPTNHLDILSIEWLERQLIDFNGAIVFVTHDRAFLRRVANRIGELDRGKLNLWEGDYTGFLEFRERQLAEEERHNALFDKRLAQEETWIRQGIKARRTRNEGRVRALKKMREERAQRRDKTQQARMTIASEARSGKLVAEFQEVSFAWGEKCVIDNFTGSVLRGDKIGLIGPNGVGKSTFLKLLLGELSPSSGTVRMGTNLTVAYFDQLRDQLDLTKNAIDNIAGGREFIDINGQSRHVISYLNDFLFTGERARTPIRALSGGERNRILLAKLFSAPTNLLVMDEPTNDLDAETLELLEDLLGNYDGTLLLVSHDREFLDNVVTSTIAFEGNGRLVEYVGGYEDWLRQGGKWVDPTESEQGSTLSGPAKSVPLSEDSPPQPVAKQSPPPKTSVKLGYKLQRELDVLPSLIERVEGELSELQAEVSAPEFYQRPQQEVADKLQDLAEREALLQQHYQRWEELEQMKEGT